MQMLPGLNVIAMGQVKGPPAEQLGRAQDNQNLMVFLWPLLCAPWILVASVLGPVLMYMVFILGMHGL